MQRFIFSTLERMGWPVGMLFVERRNRRHWRHSPTNAEEADWLFALLQNSPNAAAR
jgi:hypothetical protein